MKIITTGRPRQRLSPTSEKRIMSKTKDYVIDLEEKLDTQLTELGFDSLTDAITAGYVVANDKLVKLEGLAQEEAHKAWLKEKEEVLSILQSLKFDIEFAKFERTVTDEYYAMIDRVIDFVEKGEI